MKSHSNLMYLKVPRLCKCMLELSSYLLDQASFGTESVLKLYAFAPNTHLDLCPTTLYTSLLQSFVIYISRYHFSQIKLMSCLSNLF